MLSETKAFISHSQPLKGNFGLMQGLFLLKIKKKGILEFKSRALGLSTIGCQRDLQNLQYNHSLAGWALASSWNLFG